MPDTVSSILILILLTAGCVAVVLLKTFTELSVFGAIVVGFPAAFCLLIATAFIIESHNNR
jgi:hypothetical protein